MKIACDAFREAAVENEGYATALSIEGLSVISMQMSMVEFEGL